LEIKREQPVYAVQPLQFDLTGRVESHACVGDKIVDHARD
jgi:hypothetical protein